MGRSVHQPLATLQHRLPAHAPPAPAWRTRPLPAPACPPSRGRDDNPPAPAFASLCSTPLHVSPPPVHNLLQCASPHPLSPLRFCRHTRLPASPPPPHVAFASCVCLLHVSLRDTAPSAAEPTAPTLLREKFFLLFLLGACRCCAGGQAASVRLPRPRARAAAAWVPPCSRPPPSSLLLAPLLARCYSTHSPAPLAPSLLPPVCSAPTTPARLEHCARLHRPSLLRCPVHPPACPTSPFWPRPPLQKNICYDLPLFFIRLLHPACVITIPPCERGLHWQGVVGVNGGVEVEAPAGEGPPPGGRRQPLHPPLRAVLVGALVGAQSKLWSPATNTTNGVCLRGQAACSHVGSRRSQLRLFLAPFVSHVHLITTDHQKHAEWPRSRAAELSLQRPGLRALAVCLVPEEVSRNGIACLAPCGARQSSETGLEASAALSSVVCAVASRQQPHGHSDLNAACRNQAC